MEHLLSWGSFRGIERVKLFINVHLSATWILWTKCRYCHHLEKFLRTPMQLIDVRNEPFLQALFPQKSFDEFWRSAYKSYSVFSVKAIKIILPFASSWLCGYGFSSLAEIKSKKRETSWNWRQNAGVLANDGTSFQCYFFPKTGTLIALITFKATLFCSKCSANFCIFLVRRKLNKFENHWCWRYARDKYVIKLSL